MITSLVRFICFMVKAYLGDCPLQAQMFLGPGAILLLIPQESNQVVASI